MRSILPLDEINKLNESIRARLQKGEKPKAEDILDEMLDIFLLTYATANRVTGESLDYEYEPSTAEVMEIVNEVVAGETWTERVENYLGSIGSAEGAARNATVKTSSGSTTPTGKTDYDAIANGLVRIVETESHRIANEAALKTAGKAGATYKKWVTMNDEKVRSTHSYLEGQSVPYDADFYTYDGDHARAPGLFALPENNINCRCELQFTK